MLLLYSLAAFLTLSSCSAASVFPRASPVVNQTTCDGKQFTYQYLAGYGFIPSNARDKYGDTIGGIGSSIALDRSSWKKKSKRGKDYYTGVLYVLPDRGWYKFPDPLFFLTSSLHFLHHILNPPSPLHVLLSRSTPLLFNTGTPKARSTTRTGCINSASRSRPTPPPRHPPPPHRTSSLNTWTRSCSRGQMARRPRVWTLILRATCLFLASHLCQRRRMWEMGLEGRGLEAGGSRLILVSRPRFSLGV